MTDEPSTPIAPNLGERDRRGPNLDKPTGLLNPTEQKELAENLGRAKRYGSPRRVWVEDGHVFVEGHDGELISMTPEVAIEMARKLGEAGGNSLVNRVLDASSKADLTATS